MKVIVNCLLICNFLLVSSAQAERFLCRDAEGKEVIRNVPCSSLLEESEGKSSQPKITLSDLIPKVIEYKQPSDKLVTACLDRHRDELKDPQSPYVQKAIIKVTVSEMRLILDARAKNSFGGYVPTVLECPLVRYQIDKDAFYQTAMAQPYAITFNQEDVQ